MAFNCQIVGLANRNGKCPATVYGQSHRMYLYIDIMYSDSETETEVDKLSPRTLDWNRQHLYTTTRKVTVSLTLIHIIIGFSVCRSQVTQQKQMQMWLHSAFIR